MKNILLNKFILLNVCIFLLIIPFNVIASEYVEINNISAYYGQYDVSTAIGLKSPLKINNKTTDFTRNFQNICPQSEVSYKMLQSFDWSNSGGNAQRNGQSDNTGPVVADLIWSGARNSIISWLPVTEGNRLFVIRQTGWPGAVNESPVICMDLSTGQELWIQNIPYHTNDWTTWIAGAKNGRVYASRSGNGASVDDNLYCLNAQTGQILWISTDLIDAGPYDGVVFAPDGDPVIASFYDIWRINSEDGQTVWHSNRVGSVSGSCGGAIYGDALYVADATGGGHVIVKFDLNTGQKLYASSVMPGFTLQNTPMVGPDGTVYLSRTQNNPGVDYFYAFTDTGTGFVQKWHIVCAWTTFSEFAVGADGGVYCIIPGPRIGKIDPNGNIIAQSELVADPAYSYLAPHFAVDFDGNVYFSNGGFSDGKLTVFNSDLISLWNVSVTNINIGGPCLGEAGTLVVCGTGTNMKAYRTNVSNEPPDEPGIDGPNHGKPGVEYTYFVNLSDPDNDSLYVSWDWGDGIITEWVGPFASGTQICASHTWDEKGTYIISISIRDEHGASVTAYKEVKMPRFKEFFLKQQILLLLLNRFTKFI